MRASLLGVSSACSMCQQVAVEEVSGALNLVFMNTPITNAYHNLTNIIMRVSPKRALGQPAVLINAHYDSAFGSPGDLSHSPLSTREHIHKQFRPPFATSCESIAALLLVDEGIAGASYFQS